MKVIVLEVYSYYVIVPIVTLGVNYIFFGFLDKAQKIYFFVMLDVGGEK